MRELAAVLGPATPSLFGIGTSADRSAADRAPPGRNRPPPRPPPSPSPAQPAGAEPAVALSRRGLVLEAIAWRRAGPVQPGEPPALAGTVRVAPLAPGELEPTGAPVAPPGPWREGARIATVLGPAGTDALLADVGGVAVLLRGARLHLPAGARLRIAWEGAPHTLDEPLTGLDPAEPSGPARPGPPVGSSPSPAMRASATSGMPPGSPNEPDLVGLSLLLGRSATFPTRSDTRPPPPTAPTSAVVTLWPILATEPDASPLTVAASGKPWAQAPADPARAGPAAILALAALAAPSRKSSIGAAADAELPPAPSAGNVGATDVPAGYGEAASPRAAPSPDGAPAVQRTAMAAPGDSTALAEAVRGLASALALAIEEVTEREGRDPERQPARSREPEEGRSRFVLVLPELGRIELRLAWSPRGVELAVSGLPASVATERATFRHTVEAALAACGARGRVVLLPSGRSSEPSGGALPRSAQRLDVAGAIER